MTNPWLIMVLGMSTVFIGLVVLILITKLMSAIICAAGKKTAVVPPELPSQAPALEAAPVIADRRVFDAVVASAIAEYMGSDTAGLRICSVRQLSGANDRPALVAAVSAAIAECMGTDVKGLKIHSITKI